MIGNPPPLIRICLQNQLLVLMWRYIVILAVALTGCQSLSPQLESESTSAVRIVEEEDAVANCAEVEEVRVAAPFPFLTQSIPESASLGREEIRKDLRYQAHLVGGDTVLRTGVQGGMTLGTAYDCE